MVRNRHWRCADGSFNRYHDQSASEIAGSAHGNQQAQLPTVLQCSQWLREHGGIENRVFWVLDVTYGEDRNHARGIGVALSKLRAVP